MTRRTKLILTRPSDDSLEAFVNFRKNTALKLKERKTVLIKDDLVYEWRKFWASINSTPGRKVCISNFIN